MTSESLDNYYVYSSWTILNSISFALSNLIGLGSQHRDYTKAELFQLGTVLTEASRVVFIGNTNE